MFYRRVRCKIKANKQCFQRNANIKLKDMANKRNREKNILLTK